LVVVFLYRLGLFSSSTISGSGSISFYGSSMWNIASDTRLRSAFVTALCTGISMNS
jgi:hypothetical protein